MSAKSFSIIIKYGDIKTRKKVAPPGIAMRDRSKYSRKEKHKQNYRKEGWPDGRPSFLKAGIRELNSRTVLLQREKEPRISVPRCIISTTSRSPIEYQASEELPCAQKTLPKLFLMEIGIYLYL